MRELESVSAREGWREVEIERKKERRERKKGKETVSRS